MVEIIPSINVDNFEEVIQKIKLIEPYVNYIHLDISDGVFSKHTSWHNPKDLIGFESKLKIEAHLMIDEPEKEISNWLLTPVNRIVFHQESTKSHFLLIDKIHEAGKEAGIAICPETLWLKLFPYFEKADMLQILGVNPGPSGQKLDESIIQKIGHIKHVCHPCIIEVDGGVNTKNASSLIKEGANILVSGKEIFESKDIAETIEKLKTA